MERRETTGRHRSRWRSGYGRGLLTVGGPGGSIVASFRIETLLIANGPRDGARMESSPAGVGATFYPAGDVANPALQMAGEVAAPIAQLGFSRAPRKGFGWLMEVGRQDVGTDPRGT